MKLKAIAAIIVFILCASLYAQPENDAHYFYSKGNEFYDAGEYDSAIEYYKKALPLCEKKYGINDMYTANCYSFIGYSYLEKGEINAALPYCQKALKIFESSNGNISFAANVYHYIGTAYDNNEEYGKAISYYEKALAIRKTKEGKNEKEEAKLYRSIGRLYVVKTDFDEAWKNLEKALEIMERIGAQESRDFVGMCDDICAYYFERRS